jgi:hypothetical protein
VGAGGLDLGGADVVGQLKKSCQRLRAQSSSLQAAQAATDRLVPVTESARRA